MKFSEINTKTKSELISLLIEKKKECFNYRFIRAAKESVKPHTIRSAKKTIARIKFVLNQFDKGVKNA